MAKGMMNSGVMERIESGVMACCWRIVSLLVLITLLNACSSNKPEKESSSTPSSPSSTEPTSEGRYPGKDNDWGPTEEIDMSHVPDAQPRYELRTIAGNKNPYTVLGKTYTLMEDERAYKQRGIASWYGYKFNGERTSNGELYDMFSMTGAHKTLPIPSYVRVTNLDNHKSVIVRINDRGPFYEGRIIDLSYAAAQRLGITRAGTGNVEVEIVVPEGDPRPPLRGRPKAGTKMIAAKAPVVKEAVKEVAKETGKETAIATPVIIDPVKNTPVTVTPNTAVSNTTVPSTSGTGDVVTKAEAGATETDSKLPEGTYLQIAAFSVEKSAEQFASSVGAKLSFPVIITSVKSPQLLYRVRVGPFKTTQSLQQARDQLQKLDILQTHIVYQ